MAYLTPDEVRQQYVVAMGPELGKTFYQLVNECAWLHAKWHEYVNLFGTSESRIDLLNRVAPRCFRLIQDALWEDVLLHISRLTDRMKVAGHETLTLRLLPERVPQSMRPQIEARLDTVLDKVAFARDWRDRYIAHRDLVVALNQGAEPLADATREAVREALEAIAALLNEVDQYSRQVLPTAYDQDSGRDGVGLLYVLRDGLEAAAARLARLKDGTARPEDYGPPRPI